MRRRGAHRGHACVVPLSQALEFLRAILQCALPAHSHVVRPEIGYLVPPHVEHTGLLGSDEPFVRAARVEITSYLMHIHADRTERLCAVH